MLEYEILHVVHFLLVLVRRSFLKALMDALHALFLVECRYLCVWYSCLRIGIGLY